MRLMPDWERSPLWVPTYLQKGANMTPIPPGETVVGQCMESCFGCFCDSHRSNLREPCTCLATFPFIFCLHYNSTQTDYISVNKCKNNFTQNLKKVTEPGPTRQSSVTSIGQSVCDFIHFLNEQNC